MGKIQKLEKLTALQIAAGEVIDRPASVVREILENAIDANGHNIQLEIFDGGIQKIILSDDGDGIAQDDLELTVERHATSKIQSISDLNQLHTLGFRGEALASIAAVAKLSITSKPKHQEYAWQIKTDGLNRKTSSPSSGIEGTRVCIEDLFYLTPARRKFLKKGNSEYHKVDQVVKKICLANIHYQLTFKNDQKIVRKIPAADSIAEAKPRIEAILGHEFSNHLHFHSHESTLGQIHSWVAHPKFSRARSDLQYIILNSRVIKDPAISNAIKRAFNDVMMIGRYPALVLYLTLDPAMIDFNVHPTKEQVKFQDIQELTRWIVTVLKKQIDQILSVSHTQTSVHSMQHQAARPIIGEKEPVATINHSATSNTLLSHNEPKVDHHQQVSFSYNDSEKLQNNIPSFNPEMNTTPPILNKAISHPQPLTLGQPLHHLGKRYILSEVEDGLIIVDAHAAHERILYEALKRQYEDIGVVSQNLIIPIEIQIDDSICQCIEEYMPVIEQFGFNVEVVSSDVIKVLGVPKLLHNSDPRKLFLDMVAELQQDSETHLISEKVNQILASIACHRSVRSMRGLSHQEMTSLLRQIEQTELANVCNHGRPTWIKMKSEEIDHLFHRG